MSLRQIKKLKGAGQTAPDKENKDQENQEDEEPEEDQPKVQKLKNAFEMFQMDEDNEEEEDNDENEEKEKSDQKGSQDKSGNAQKKKKKKNKKAKKAQAGEEGDKKEQEKEEEKLDDFDKALEEFKEESKQKESASALTINIKALDYNKELAKYFKNAKLTDKGYNDKNTREHRIMKHLRNNRNTKNFKNYKLISTDTSFMFNPERFACEMIGHNEHKMKVFALKPTKKYEELQEAYENLKNTFDPNNLFQFVQQNPFHVDGLFDVAELLRTQGDYKQVNQLLENILFAYEDSFSYEFNIFEEDDVMLSFDENQYSKTLFTALNRFIDVLGKKGCYKSAFEYNKFLVKLNPYHDPVGGLLSLDYNAISSLNIDFLNEFPHKFGKQYYNSTEYSLIYLPNYLYSCALAKFLKIVENEDLGISQYAGVRQEEFSRASKTNIDPCQEDANVVLMHAILLFPTVITGLAQANEYSKQNVSLGGDAFSGWQKKSFKDILSHKSWEQGKREYIYPSMNIANNADIEGINKVIDIYIERSKILWKNNKVMFWVKSCIGMILNQMEQGFNYEEFVEGLFTAEFKYKLPFELSRYKGLNKWNFSDRVERIDFNNIPDNVQGPAQNDQARGYNPINPNSGLLNLIFGSLLPWNHAPRDNQQGNRRHNPDDVEIEEEEF